MGLDVMAELERFANVLATMPEKDAVYRVPEDDNPATWTGLHKFCHADEAYRYLYELSLWECSGIYCPSCGEAKPGDDWLPALCLGHWFDEHGYELVMKSARWASGRLKTRWDA